MNLWRRFYARYPVTLVWGRRAPPPRPMSSGESGRSDLWKTMYTCSHNRRIFTYPTHTSTYTHGIHRGMIFGKISVEVAAHKVLKVTPNYEIREYAPAVTARSYSNEFGDGGLRGDQFMGPSFGALAGYIGVWKKGKNLDKVGSSALGLSHRDGFCRTSIRSRQSYSLFSFSFPHSFR